MTVGQLVAELQSQKNQDVEVKVYLGNCPVDLSIATLDTPSIIEDDDGSVLLVAHFTGE